MIKAVNMQEITTSARVDQGTNYRRMEKIAFVCLFLFLQLFLQFYANLHI